jgi:hypothetical protein
MRWTTYNEWLPISLSKQQPDCRGLGVEKPIVPTLRVPWRTLGSKMGQVVNRKSAFGNWQFQKAFVRIPLVNC